MQTGKLPAGFLLEITTIPGSKEKVCLQAIKHYQAYLDYPDSVVQEIAKAMVGNLTEYYNTSHKGSRNFELALPHLSEAANFMDSKNTASMDVQSTARIKSFYSTYEKLLIDCCEQLMAKKPILENGLVKDLIATRDVLYPRYQLKNDPQAFYKSVYRTALEFMEYIDDLSKENPEYGFEEFSERKQQDIAKPKKYSLDLGCISIPEKDFTDYALELRNIPPVYRHLIACSPKMVSEHIYNNIVMLQVLEDEDEIMELPLVQALKNQVKKESLVEFRNELEQEVIDNMTRNMYKDYRDKSKDDFMYIYKFSLKPEHLDFLEIVNRIDEAIDLDHWSVDFSDFGHQNITRFLLTQKTNELLARQEKMLYDRLDMIKKLDLEGFDKNFEQAQKIKRFALCSKDYMRNPKESLYQSFHVTVKTPFGFYEKQIRTEEQHKFAEYGHASHSNTYKPYEKENFHLLKVPTPLLPSRDETGEIITPLQLRPLGISDSIREYYHQGFEFFSGGLSFEELKSVYQNEEDFERTLLELGPSKGKMKERVEGVFSRLISFIRPKKSTDDLDPHDNR